MTDTRFTPGAATAYVTDTVLALSGEPVVDAELMRLCAVSTDWPTLADAARERHVAALVLIEDDRLQLGVTGDASVVVETVDGDRRFDGSDTWTAGTVDHGHLVTLSSGGAPAGVGAPYRIDGGVIPASIVSRRLAEAAEPAADPFELLFGHTVARSVETAAVRPATYDQAPRAPLGVLVFASGERVEVDRPIVLGRHPRPLDDEAGGARPRLVKLTQAGVSRRHAAIRLDRWTASIEDLGSANGTTVTFPGRNARVLAPGHPLDLVAGAVIDLGGEVTFVVEEIA